MVAYFYSVGGTHGPMPWTYHPEVFPVMSPAGLSPVSALAGHLSFLYDSGALGGSGRVRGPDWWTLWWLWSALLRGKVELEQGVRGVFLKRVFDKSGGVPLVVVMDRMGSGRNARQTEQATRIHSQAHVQRRAQTQTQTQTQTPRQAQTQTRNQTPRQTYSAPPPLSAKYTSPNQTPTKSYTSTPAVQSSLSQKPSTSPTTHVSPKTANTKFPPSPSAAQTPKSSPSRARNPNITTAAPSVPTASSTLGPSKNTAGLVTDAVAREASSPKGSSGGVISSTVKDVPGALLGSVVPDASATVNKTISSSVAPIKDVAGLLTDAIGGEVSAPVVPATSPSTPGKNVPGHLTDIITSDATRVANGNVGSSSVPPERLPGGLFSEAPALNGSPRPTTRVAKDIAPDILTDTLPSARIEKPTHQGVLTTTVSPSPPARRSRIVTLPRVLLAALLALVAITMFRNRSTVSAYLARLIEIVHVRASVAREAMQRVVASSREIGRTAFEAAERTAREAHEGAQRVVDAGWDATERAAMEGRQAVDRGVEAVKRTAEYVVEQTARGARWAVDEVKQAVEVMGGGQHGDVDVHGAEVEAHVEKALLKGDGDGAEEEIVDSVQEKKEEGLTGPDYDVVAPAHPDGGLAAVPAETHTHPPASTATPDISGDTPLSPPLKPDSSILSSSEIPVIQDTYEPLAPASSPSSPVRPGSLSTISTPPSPFFTSSGPPTPRSDASSPKLRGLMGSWRSGVEGDGDAEGEGDMDGEGLEASRVSEESGSGSGSEDAEGEVALEGSEWVVVRE